MICCGWCGWPTPDEPRCVGCNRDPQLPWRQRGQTAPVISHAEAGRPALDAAAIRAAYLGARERLGPKATVEAIAEALDRSPRTIREWRKRFVLP